MENGVVLPLLYPTIRPFENAEHLLIGSSAVVIITTDANDPCCQLVPTYMRATRSATVSFFIFGFSRLFYTNK